MEKMIKKTGIKLLFLSLLFIGICQASEIKVDTQNILFSAETFQNNLSQAMERILSHQSEVRMFTELLWRFFTLYMIIWLGIRFSIDGLSMDEIISAFMIIGITRILLTYYDDWTVALFDWSIGFGNGIQKAIIGHDNIWYVPQLINNMVNSLSFKPLSFLSKVVAVIETALLFLLSISLSIFAVAATLWSLWGYALAKMIGFMFIPTLLFDKLSWIFDGWFKLFFGFLLYGVIARACLSLIAIALQSYLGFNPFGENPMNYQFVPIESSSDVIGLAALLFMGNASLACISKFTGVIVGGIPSLNRATPGRSRW